jgi:hypothetical protein
MLRRLLAVAATSALLLGVGSASADGGVGKGAFEINTIAGMGESYTGKLNVKGDGKFTVKDEGGKLVFTVKVIKPREGHEDEDLTIRMKDGRQKHTVGDDSKLGLKWDSKITLEVEKGKLTFPEAGKESSGTAPGKLSMLGKTSDVNVKYTVKEAGGKYTISSASFDFDYTKHTKGNEKVCLGIGPAKVCVKPQVNISVSRGVVEAQK